MKKLFNNSRAWVGILGLAVGILVGVTLSAGLGFDKDNAARFFGAFIGALIAVSGAIALHYLKDIESEQSRREHFSSLIKKAEAFCDLSLKCFEGDESDQGKIAAFGTFQAQMERVKRYAEKHEFDDLKISEANLHLHVAMLMKIDAMGTSELDQKMEEKMVTAMKIARTSLLRSREKLEGLQFGALGEAS